MTTLTMLLIGAIAGQTIYMSSPEEPIEEVQTRYEQQCATAVTPACKQMQWRLEFEVYSLLRTYPQIFDLELLETALNADVPQLQSYGLRRMPEINPFPKQLLPRVAALLQSPYAIVRRNAMDVLTAQDPRYVRFRDERSADYSGRPSVLMSDELPDPKTFGAPIYKGATFLRFASTERYAWYTTPDPPDRVVTFYSTGGRKARTADELTSERESRMSEMTDPSAMIEIMMKAQMEGKSPEEMQAMLMGKAMAGASVSLDPFQKEGMVNPRFLELDSTGQRLLAIFRDDVLGATAIVFMLPDPQAAMATELIKLSADEQLKRQMSAVEVQEILSKPLIVP